MGRTHCTRLRDPLSGQPGTIHPMTTIRDWRSPGRILPQPALPLRGPVRPVSQGLLVRLVVHQPPVADGGTTHKLVPGFLWEEQAGQGLDAGRIPSASGQPSRWLVTLSSPRRTRISRLAHGQPLLAADRRARLRRCRRRRCRLLAAVHEPSPGEGFLFTGRPVTARELADLHAINYAVPRD